MDGTAVYALHMPADEFASAARPMRNDPDAMDVSRFQEGDEVAFEELVRRREREVYQVAYRLLGDREDAQEAVQEAFLIAFRSLKGFRGDAAFRTWLVGITINVCRNRAAKAEEKVRRRSLPADPAPADGETPGPLPLRDPAPGPDQRLLGDELRRALDRALALLAPEHREIVVLREVQGMEYEELAAALGCPVGTVKSRLCRARQALREVLEGVWP